MNMDRKDKQRRLKGIVSPSSSFSEAKKNAPPSLQKTPDFILSPEVRGCEVEEVARSGGG